MKSKSNEQTTMGYSGYKRGLWTSEEDRVLMDHVKVHGQGKWNRIPKVTGLKRCGKSCRLRWMNYLSPTIKRGDFSADEGDLIIRLHRLLGNRWLLIAGRVPGRTDNQVKNYWNSHLRKKQAAIDSLQDTNFVRKPKLPQHSTSPPGSNGDLGDKEHNKLPADYQAVQIGLRAVATSNATGVQGRKQPNTVVVCDPHYDDNNDDDTRGVVEQHGYDDDGGAVLMVEKDQYENECPTSNSFMVYPLTCPSAVSNNIATTSAAEHYDHRNIFDDDDELFIINRRDFSDFLIEYSLGEFLWDINYSFYS